MSNNGKKVVAILGSPRRNGNSAALAEEIKNGAISAGAKVEEFFLVDLRIAPCAGCGACKAPGAKGCVISDDMSLLYPKLAEADAFIFSSPIYWAGVSGQFKAFLDRCYAATTFEPFSTPFTGKTAAVAFSYGGADVFESGCVNAVRAMKDVFEFVGCKAAGFVWGKAHEAGEIVVDKKTMEKAFKTGIALAGR